MRPARARHWCPGEWNGFPAEGVGEKLESRGNAHNTFRPHGPLVLRLRQDTRTGPRERGHRPTLQAAGSAQAPNVKNKIAILAALAAFLSLCRGDQPVATAKIAEWAASSRGGRADYQELSHGKTIDIDSLACPGKITVVDFSSDYCAPCVQLAMFLIKTSKAYPQRYAIRRVNINRPGVAGIDWQSPVSTQYRLDSLPMIVVYDDKVKVAEGSAARKWLMDDISKMAAKPDDAQKK